MKVTAEPLLRSGRNRTLWDGPIRHRHEISWSEDGALTIELACRGMDNSDATYRYTLVISPNDQQAILCSRYAAEAERKVQALEEELRLIKLQQEFASGGR